jgi:uncharacterized Zn finger protein
MASVADHVDEAALQARAGKDAFAAGVAWADEGLVRMIEFGPLHVRATVVTADEPIVDLTSNGDQLGWSCTCAEGAAGGFCAHAVAVSTDTWRKAPKRSSEEPVEPPPA